MKTKGLRSRQFKLSLAITFLMLGTLPFALYSILQDATFDTGSEATEEDQPIVCEISFPFVSPISIQEDTTVQLRLTAQEFGGTNELEYEDIESIVVTSENQGELFSQTYEVGDAVNNASLYSESFTYKGLTTGNDTLSGVVTSVLPSGDKTSTACKVVTPLSANTVTIAAVNGMPIFSTSPNSANPSNDIKDGDTYSYTLTATDPEGDDISYYASFTPNADWMKISTIKDGSGGQLEIKFEGVPDTPESYLANVFIHDGYNQHLSSQSWTISVSPSSNDTPQVTVATPEKGDSYTKGEDATISWTATDRNQIINYKVYLAENPASEEDWIELVSLNHNYGAYILDTTNVAAGNYVAIVEATDNQDPALTGKGTSGLFTISATPIDDTTDNEPDDGPVLTIPQIKDITPENGAKLENLRPTIGGTLIAGKDATVETTTITLTIDDQDVTDDIEFVKQSDSEFKVIYKSDENMDGGEHKIALSFKDSNGKTASEEWTFTINNGDSDTISIFGFEIAKRTAIIIGVGLLIILAALAVPWILYMAWKGNEDKQEYDIYSTGSGFSDYTPNTSPEPTYTPTVTSTPQDNIGSTTDFSTGVGFIPDSQNSYENTEVSYTPEPSAYMPTGIENPVTEADELADITEYDIPQPIQPEAPVPPSEYAAGEDGPGYDYNNLRNGAQSTEISTDTASAPEAPVAEVVETPISKEIPVQNNAPAIIESSEATQTVNKPVFNTAQPGNDSEVLTGEIDKSTQELNQLAEALQSQQGSDPYAFLEDSDKQ